MESLVIDFVSAKDRILNRLHRNGAAKAARAILVQREDDYLKQMIEADYLQLKAEQPDALYSTDCFVRMMRKRAKNRFQSVERTYAKLLKEKVKEIKKERTDE